MRTKLFITLFISLTLICVFLHLHKESIIINLSYTKQKNEKTLTKLYEHKKQLAHELYTLQNRTTIKQFAKAELAMESMRLAAIRKWPHTHE